MREIRILIGLAIATWFIYIVVVGLVLLMILRFG